MKSIEELEAEIESMKCCGNCNHYESFGLGSFEYCDLGHDKEAECMEVWMAHWVKQGSQ